MTVSGHASPAAIDGVTIAFTVIAAIAVFLRLLTRLRIVHNGGIDDIFIVAALVGVLDRRGWHSLTRTTDILRRSGNMYLRRG